MDLLKFDVIVMVVILSQLGIQSLLSRIDFMPLKNSNMEGFMVRCAARAQNFDTRDGHTYFMEVRSPI